MKLSKDELKTKVNELVEDNDKAIQLLEDIEDSMEQAPDTTEADELKAKVEEMQSKFDDLQEKYKQRFLSGDDKKPDDTYDKIDELEEKNIIDIKEI